MLHRSITGTILVADDQAANRELLEELLTPQGCKVVTVADGAAALEELTRAQFDLVLLDVMMPHLNGFEVCEKIKNNPDTYLIFSDRKSTRLNSSHQIISYAVFCLKKKKITMSHVVVYNLVAHEDGVLQRHDT